MSIHRKSVSIGLIYCLCSMWAWGQHSRAALENKKQEALRRIAAAERILLEIGTEKETHLAQFSLLDKQIEEHENLLSTVAKELEYINVEIAETSSVILSLEEDVSFLKKEYGEMVYRAYKHKLGVNQLTFLFASKSFRQLLLRIKYLTSYAEQRRIQLAAIEKLYRTLDKQSKTLQTKRRKQEQLLNEEERRKANLILLQKKQKKLLSTLSKKEKSWRKRLKQERQSIARLNAHINALIAKERSKAGALGKLDKATYQRLSLAFEAKKKKLHWPVSNGIVSSKFGRQPHPVFKSIQQNNIGVEIQTAKNTLVKAIFEGVVSEIALIPGMHSVIIVQHGSYRTVYARLATVLVRKGQYIDTQQPIGEVYTNSQSLSTLHFEVWQETKKLNPENWLVSK